MCNSKTSLQVWARNSCKEPIDVKVCINHNKRDAGWVWSCKMETGIQPAAKLNQAFWTCDSTGKVVFWVRKAGDTKTKFPTEPSELPTP